MVRAPAMAAESAAFWAWLRAMATMPMSMASASMPIRATVQMATSGRTAPRRGCLRVLSLMGASAETREPWSRGLIRSVRFAAHAALAAEGQGFVHVQEGRDDRGISKRNVDANVLPELCVVRAADVV